MTRVHAAVSALIFSSTGVQAKAANSAAKSAPKPWHYVLIPHDAIDASAMFGSLVRL
jgi:hypothetical protein